MELLIICMENYNKSKGVTYMNLKLQLTTAFMISLLSLIGFSCMAILISRQKIVSFDSTVISFIQGLESPLLTDIMKFFTFIGSTVSVAVLTMIALFFLYIVLGHRSELILLTASILGSNLLFITLKLFFQRARPDLYRLIEVSGYSFPSGHATNACTLYGILAFLLWRHIPTRLGRTVLIISSIMMILTVGISRIYLGVHYPSDIIGGYCISAFWLTMLIWFYQQYKEKQYIRLHTRESTE